MTDFQNNPSSFNSDERAQRMRERERRRERQKRRKRIAVATAISMSLIVAITLTLTSGTAKAHTHNKPKKPPISTSTTHPVSTTTTQATPQPQWRVAWGDAMAWGYGEASNVTVRDLATVPIGGQALRVRISNLYGNAPLVIGAATVGIQATGATIVPGTLEALTFSGAPGVTIPVGGEIYSDPTNMSIASMQTLAISLYVSDTDLVTVHPCCTANVKSYFTSNGGGNLTNSISSAGFVVASPWGRWLDAVDLLETTGQGSIVVIGDSITDGYHTALRWTHVLQQRINALPPPDQRAVINEAITANALTSIDPTDADKGGGPSGLSRLGMDAFSQPGISEVVLFLGTNDLWFGVTAQQLLAGYQQAIAMAKAANVPIIGVTLLPRSTSVKEIWTPLQQSYLEQVNNWILTSGSFNGVLDFATVMEDVYNGACQPTLMFPPYDSGDNLHPNPAGQTALADSINPTVLGLPASLPQVPPLVNVTPTPGCTGAEGLPSATPPTTVPVPPTTTTTTTTTSTTSSSHSSSSHSSSSHS